MPETVAAAPHGPFRNSTVFGFMNWVWSGSSVKSIAKCTRLLNFLKSDTFNKEDLKDFDLKAETTNFDKVLDGSVADALGWVSGAKDGWKEAAVNIEVPDGKKRTASDPIPTFSVPGLHFRNLTQTIKDVLEDRASRYFHYTPFKHFWQRAPDEPVQHIYDEIYSSNAYIEAHSKIQQQLAEPNCILERVVAALMFWSIRDISPTLGPHPSGLSTSSSGTGPKFSSLPFATWASARAPAASWTRPTLIKLVPSATTSDVLIPNVSMMTTAVTRARLDLPQGSKRQEHGCRALALSEITGPNSDYTNIFVMLVVDFMHDFELGVWKAVFTHLIRILVAHGGDVVQALNTRYRQVPTFGKGTIHQFTNNTSAMKKLLLITLRIYYSALFFAIIQDLLFTLAYWHALAKLCMHINSTLNCLQDMTKQLFWQLRYFTKVTCAAFSTRELPKEEAACGRRNGKKAATANAAGRPLPAATGGSKIKVFNMITYKGHSLGDSVRTIFFLGTIDSYSTQPCEVEHGKLKLYWRRTSKNDAVGQITQLERPCIPEVASFPENPDSAAKRKRPGKKPTKKVLPALDFAESESLPYTNQADLAVQDFQPKFQEHLLGRLVHPTWSGTGNEFSAEERNQVSFVGNHIYRHKVLRINFTTYDVHTGGPCKVKVNYMQI
ncbi:hypothetical protein C8R46DRAFT_1214519 [Mycena filopes]|nr:hypothetical protein C8R46DRAFT_1214519 [Mycena filopes]